MGADRLIEEQLLFISRAYVSAFVFFVVPDPINAPLTRPTQAAIATAITAFRFNATAQPSSFPPPAMIPISPSPPSDLVTLLPPSPVTTRSSNSSTLGIVVGVAVGGFVLLCVVGLVGLYILNRRRRSARAAPLTPKEAASSPVKPPPDPGNDSHISVAVSGGDSSLHSSTVYDNVPLLSGAVPSTSTTYIDPSELLATAQLTDRMCLARGFFGKVFVVNYKGRVCALKVFELQNALGMNLSKDFFKEVTLLSKVGKHEHMVDFIAHSASEGTPLQLTECFYVGEP